MLRGHMMGDNRVRFTDATENMIARARRSSASSQMQLICESGHHDSHDKMPNPNETGAFL